MALQTMNLGYGKGELLPLGHASALGTGRPLELGPGQWMGVGANGLGLSGRVKDRALETVLAGRHPGTGKKLVDEGRDCAGFVVVLDTPPGVDHLVEDGGPKVAQEVAAAQSEAVVAGFDHLERRASWMPGGSNPYDRSDAVRTQGLIAAAFTSEEHGQTGPYARTVLVIANFGESADGRWGRLGDVDMGAQVAPTESLHRAEFRGALSTGLGVGWRLNSNDTYEIAEHFTRGQPDLMIDEGRFHRKLLGPNCPDMWRRHDAVGASGQLILPLQPGANYPELATFSFSQVVAAWAEALPNGGRVADVYDAVGKMSKTGRGSSVGSERWVPAERATPPFYQILELGRRPASSGLLPAWYAGAEIIEKYRTRWLGTEKGKDKVRALGVEDGSRGLADIKGTKRFVAHMMTLRSLGKIQQELGRGRGGDDRGRD
jgi:hypothetical protein